MGCTTVEKQSNNFDTVIQRCESSVVNFKELLKYNQVLEEDILRLESDNAELRKALKRLWDYKPELAYINNFTDVVTKESMEELK